MKVIEDGIERLKAGGVALLAPGKATLAEEGDAAGTGRDWVRIGRGGADDETL